MIYVVGNEQNYHFQVLSILLDKLGFEWGKGLVHFSYGMVELPEGKMKSREGTVVDADDLMEAMIETAKETSAELGKLDGLTQEEADNIARIVGLGALKYFILKVVSANEFFDYGAKYNGESQEITPARLPEDTAERVRLLTSAIYDILGCSGLIRIDYIITEGEKVNLLEINTTPGMTATSFIPQQVRAAGLDIKDVMTDIIENKF